VAGLSLGAALGSGLDELGGFDAALAHMWPVAAAGGVVMGFGFATLYPALGAVGGRPGGGRIRAAVGAADDGVGARRARLT
jgi:hypothetical protein